MIPAFTIVLGVDAGHLKKLSLVLPTWAKHKPSLLKVPWVVFYDRDQINPLELNDIFRGWYPGVVNLSLVPWPPQDVTYSSDESIGRFGNSQRYKMLSGFVHIPAQFVTTKYWLKIDLDVVATGHDDWIDPAWFEGGPAIVSPSWPYSKPPFQMMILDQWVARNKNDLGCWAEFPDLDLIPLPGSSILRHKRIISWCAFFLTEFTRRCSESAEKTCGKGLLPVKSQDGFIWYLAKRSNQGIVTPNMKRLGWEHFSSERSIRSFLEDENNGLHLPS